MGRPRKPLRVQESNRRVHRSTSEKAARMEAEDMGGDDSIECPSHVKGARARRLFLDTAEMLRGMGIWRRADTDQLARYVASELLWRTMTERYRKAIAAGDEGLAAAYERRQDRAFRQAQTAANALGLNVTSRCRVERPPRAAQGEKLEL